MSAEKKPSPVDEALAVCDEIATKLGELLLLRRRLLALRPELCPPPAAPSAAPSPGWAEAEAVAAAKGFLLKNGRPATSRFLDFVQRQGGEVRGDAVRKGYYVHLGQVEALFAALPLRQKAPRARRAAEEDEFSAWRAAGRRKKGSR